MRTRRQGDLDDEETKRDLVSPESAMFCTHLSHFWIRCTIATRMEIFLQGL